MSACKYCNQPAGLLSDYHKECEVKHQQGLANLIQLMTNYLRNPYSTTNFPSQRFQIETDGFLSKDDVCQCADTSIRLYTDFLQRPIPASVLKVVNRLLQSFGLSFDEANKKGAVTYLSQKIIKGHIADYFTGAIDIAQMQGRIHKVITSLPILPDDINEIYLYMLNKAANNFLKDGQLSGQEEHLLNQYMAALNIQVQNLPVKYQSGSITKIAQTAILNNVQAGNLPGQTAMLPIVLGKGESLLWTYENVTLFQEKIEKEFVGRRSGFNIPVFKGITYRIGKFKGNPIEHSYMNNIGLGTLYVTNKNLVFQSQTRAVKIPFSKLIGITPFADGIEIHKDGDAKRIALQGFDSWFVMCLLQTLNK